MDYQTKFIYDVIKDAITDAREHLNKAIDLADDGNFADTSCAINRCDVARKRINDIKKSLAQYGDIMSPRLKTMIENEITSIETLFWHAMCDIMEKSRHSAGRRMTRTLRRSFVVESTTGG